MPSREPAQRFDDILRNIEHIERFTAGFDLQTFSNDDKVVYAVKHALLIISEAAQKLDDVAVQLCPTIPWPEIRGLGNRLRHGYDTVDVARIWFIVERDLRPLKTACGEALARLRGDGSG